MIALKAVDSEIPVVEHAVLLVEQLQSNLAIIHVNDLHAGSISMMMNTPKKVTGDMIRDQVRDYGFEHILSGLDIIITKGNNIAKRIEHYCQGIDMFVLGHQRLSSL